MARRDFMLDSETCGFIGNAVLQVSIVEFKLDDPIDVEYPMICDIHRRCPPIDKFGFNGWDPATLQWWQERPHFQEYMRRNADLSSVLPYDSYTALREVTKNFDGECFVWGKNIWNDLGVINLDCYFQIRKYFSGGIGESAGFSHRAARDIYTYLEALGLDLRRYRDLCVYYNTCEHDALPDAIAQAKALKHMVQGLP